MNKKFFTLAAALMLGSAFTANAQTSGEPAGGTKFDGKVYYFLGNGSEFIGAEKASADLAAASKFTKLESATAITSTNRDYYLWSVSLSAPVNGQIYVTFTNKKSGMPMAFQANGAAVTTRAEFDASTAVKQLIWNGLYDTANDTDSNLDEYKAGGGTLEVVSGTAFVKFSTSSWVGNDPAGEAIKLYVEDPATVTFDKLNEHLGDGCSFSFTDLKTQPADNIFGQKLYAFEITPRSASGWTWMNAYTPGIYFATTPKPADVIDGDDTQNWFLTTNFVAVSPVEHMGIPSLTQANGVGFKLVTVLGNDLKTTAPTKKEVSSANAAFKVVKPSPVNEPNNYALSVKPYVKKDASKDDQTQDLTALNVVTSKVMGNDYVTVSKGTAAKLKFSDSNLLAVKDLLKKDGASVFNILFKSGEATQTPTNPNEFGKYLGIKDATSFLAQGPNFVELNNPEMQWVIVDADATANTFTFKNRENGKTFTTSLRKTANANEYELTAPSMAVAYLNANGAYNTDNLASRLMTAELIPATIDKTGGYADYADEELTNLVKLQFEVGGSLVTKDIYVTATPDANPETVVNLGTSQDIFKAAQWEIIKRTGISDSIYSKMSYAYLDKDGKVQKDGEVEDRAIVTYSIKLYRDGKDAYYDGTLQGLSYKKLIAAPRIAIKENVDGTVALVKVTGTDYPAVSNLKTIGINKTNGNLVYNTESVYALPTDAQKSYLYFGTEEATPSLESVSRHASFEAVNGGFLGVGAEGDAIIAATKDEAQELTFWLDTADVEKYTPSFYISQGIKAETKADEAVARNFLFNAKDSVSYYDAGSASTISDPTYKLISGETKAIFKAATLVNKDSVNTVIKGKEVGLNSTNGLKNFKFNIVLADADVADEYVIKSVADNNYVANINGKVALVPNTEKAMVVKLGAGDATANEAIAAEGVQVIGGQGVVTVQGAAGKVVTVSNILGQTIANQVATSDNVTIAVPAGIVVVAVDGEATKVVVK